MQRINLYLGIALLLVACQPNESENSTGSSDRKTLRIYNAHDDAGLYFSVSGLILVPLTGVVSGTYVAINNIYNLGEERIVCGPLPKETKRKT